MNYWITWSETTLDSHSFIFWQITYIHQTFLDLGQFILTVIIPEYVYKDLVLLPCASVLHRQERDRNYRYFMNLRYHENKYDTRGWVNLPTDYFYPSNPNKINQVQSRKSKSTLRVWQSSRGNALMMFALACHKKQDAAPADSKHGNCEHSSNCHLMNSPINRSTDHSYFTKSETCGDGAISKAPRYDQVGLNLPKVMWLQLT